MLFAIYHAFVDLSNFKRKILTVSFEHNFFTRQKTAKQNTFSFRQDYAENPKFGTSVANLFPSFSCFDDCSLRMEHAGSKALL